MVLRKYIFVLILTLLIAYPLPVLAKDSRGIGVVANGQFYNANWGNYHALIIGINAYKEWNPLQTAVKDAQALREILIERYGFAAKNVILRTDKQATRHRIIRDLRNMATNMEEADNLLIYYAGHGQLDDITGDGYWIPVEGRLDYPSTWISQYTIKSILSSKRVRGKNIVVVADSCYSGTMLRGGPSLLPLDDLGYRKKLAKAATRRSRQVITSGGVEPVADGGQDGHSLFAYYLLKALKENEREVIDIENLFHTRVWEYVTEIGDQRPNVGRLKTPMDDDGQFVLVDRESQAKKLALQEREKQEREQLMALMAEKERLEAEKKRLEAEKQLLEEKRYLESERLKIELEKEKQKLAKEALEAEKKWLEAEKQFRAARMAYEEELKQAKEQRLTSKGQNDVRIKELEAKLKQEKLKSKQLAYIQKEPSLSSSSLKLAVFPLKLTNFSWGDDFSYKVSAVQNIDKAIIDDKNFIPQFSYYDFKITKTRKISENILSKSVIDDIWIKRSFFSQPEPNVDLICKIGRQLQVDAILTYHLYFTKKISVTAFLINVKTKKTYDANLEWARTVGFNAFQEFKTLNEQVYAKFTRDKSLQ